MLQAIKVLMLARSSKKKFPNLQNVNSQMRAKRRVFGKHDLFSIGYNVELELTLPFLLGPVPWSLNILRRVRKQIKNCFRHSSVI